MSNTNSASTDTFEDVAADLLSKRYEALVALRQKANKGKGAWYWPHFEPILIRNPDNNKSKAVKLKCIRCGAAFSASNPSRTASEHLKRGACPNSGSMLKPISQLPPLASPNHRKRSSNSQHPAGCSSNVYDPGLCLKPQPLLSGGREDLRPLALLQDSVKKLKSPKASPVPPLNEEQVHTAFDLLSDWFYEVCGFVSFSSLEHSKFKAFLNQIGLPEVSKAELLGSRLISKFEIARSESEARIRDAAFFQVASDGWRNKISSDKCLVKFVVNLPNGTRVFHKVVCSNVGKVPWQYAEEVFSEMIRGICGNNPQKCVGIVSDKLKILELQNIWMVNITCQAQALFSLIKDLYRELPLFRTVTDNCLKIANLFNSNPHIRSCFHKFRLQGLASVGFIRVPPKGDDVSKNLTPFMAMLEDILTCSQVLHLVVLDDDFKAASISDPAAGDVGNMIKDVGFWNCLEAAHSLVKLIMSMAEEIEAEKPLISQCLPLWKEVRSKVKEWLTKYSFPEERIEKIIERRFRKNYHPAWSAAFILDPLYLVRDGSGKYLPPYNHLSREQEKDVDKLVMQLVSMEDAPIALMELMKWRSEGLDPLYAQAVQVKKRDAVTGKLKVANPQSSRLVWETCLKEFQTLGTVAVRLLFLHATSCGIKWDSSFTRWFSDDGCCSRIGLETAHKLAYVAANARLKMTDFEENDAEVLGSEGMVNEAIASLKQSEKLAS